MTHSRQISELGSVGFIDTWKMGRVLGEFLSFYKFSLRTNLVLPGQLAKTWMSCSQTGLKNKGIDFKARSRKKKRKLRKRVNQRGEP